MVGRRGGRVIIGKYCSIGGAMAFFAHDHNIHNISSFPFGESGMPISKLMKPPLPGRDRRNTLQKQEVNIGNDVWIGRNAILFREVTVGDGAVIGAYSTITKDVPPYSVVVGNDRIVRKRFSDEDIKFLLKLKWWDFEDQEVADIGNILCSPDIGGLRKWAEENGKCHKNKVIKMSFFAKQPNHARSDGHLQRVSSLVRANQIAEYIGAKLNPQEGYENDVCIYVKPPVRPGPGSDLKFEGKKAYLDICDSTGLYFLAKKHPEVPVISASKYNYKLLKRVIPNEIINIPQQHCNFERVKRSRDGITTVGCIGTLPAFSFLPKGLKEALAERGIELLEFSKFFSRQDVVNFYMKIDIQIIWIPYVDKHPDMLLNPLKLQNSAAFGVPTIAYDVPVFKEMKGCYIPVHTLDEFLTSLDKLRENPALYKKISNKCLKKAEEYHIENVAKLYLDLLKSKRQIQSGKI